MIRTKSQMTADINADITTNGAGAITGQVLNDIMRNMNDSYQSVIQTYTSAQRDALPTPTDGDLIYNSDTDRLEVYAGGWMPTGASYQGTLNCSGNPNYPASKEGDLLRISAAGFIGGASGYPVSVGDLVLCIESTVAGDHATVGSKFRIFQTGSCTTRIDKTYQIMGVPMVRKSDGTSDAQPLLYSTGSEFVILFPVADFEVLGTASIVFPTGYKFFIESCGVIVTTADTVTSQPHFSFGVNGSTSVYKASAATTGLTAAGARNNYTTLLTADGKTSVSYEIHNAANATTLEGRVYFKGFLVEDQ